MKRQTISMKQAFLWFVALLTVVACSNDKELLDVDSEPTPMRVAKNSLSETRSVEEAKAIAADFMAQSTSDGSNKAKTMRAQAQPTVQVLVKDSLPLRPGEKLPFDLPSDTLLYGVTYSDATIMIPADKNAPTVVAVLDTPTESLPTLIRENNGDNPLYETLKPAFNPDLYHLLTDEDWAKTLMPIEEDYPVGGSGQKDYNKDSDYEVFPKIFVEWEQGDPFNNQCPLIGRQRAVAGCVAIAVAQAMTLTGVPASLTHNTNEYIGLTRIKNSNSYDQYPHVGVKVSQLIASIGSAIDMKYGINASSAGLEKAVNLFQEMGMHFSQNTKNIKRTLRNHSKGFILVGSFSDYGVGHCYLIDGYKYIAYSGGENALLHVNFGWGPGKNGYFLVNLFSPVFDPNRTKDSRGNELPTFPNYGEYYCIYN